MRKVSHFQNSAQPHIKRKPAKAGFQLFQIQTIVIYLPGTLHHLFQRNR